MTLRSAGETIEVLRQTLREMEADPHFDPVDLLDLTRIILKRIAELEMETALESVGPAPSTQPSLAA